MQRFRSGQPLIDLDYPNDGGPVDQKPHVAACGRVEDLARSLVDGEEIANGHVSRIRKLQVVDIVLTEYEAIPDGLIVAGDGIDGTILGRRLLDGTGCKGSRRFPVPDAVKIICPACRKSDERQNREQRAARDCY